MEDKEIIRLFFERSEQAIQEVLQKYGQLCRKLSENILGSRSDAEECLSDVCLKLWNSIPPAKPENLPAYISRTARNTAINRLNTAHTKRRGGIDNICAELSDAFPSAVNVEQIAEEKETARHISDFLAAADKTDRIAFVLRYYYGESAEDISVSLKIPAGFFEENLGQYIGGVNTEFGISPENPYYRIADGCIYTADMKTLCLVTAEYKGREFTLPDSVQSIAPAAFALKNNEETGLTRIYIGDNITDSDLLQIYKNSTDNPSFEIVRQ